MDGWEANCIARLTGPPMSVGTKLYIGVICLAGLAALASGAANWESDNFVRFLCYLTIAVLASRLRVELPSMTGALSVNSLFALIGIVELTLAESLSLGLVSTLVHCLWMPRRRPKAVQVVFNSAVTSLAVFAGYYALHAGARLGDRTWYPVLLAGTATVYFVAGTLPVACVIALTESRRLDKVWKDGYFWSFPYYLLLAAIAALVAAINRVASWQVSLLVLPVVYLIYRSYRLYLSRLDAEKQHAEEMAALHLRTIEALALAIEAKDHVTHDHLQRVQIYAMEIARELGLCEEEIEAIRAASLLHDIGKLAVPEHIISKPGKLTPEEFEKMKIHPVVGADILEHVKFPYPVAPIVRSHHERWDGKGYPDGLRDEAIPVGARILSAVDCLDALASDRQYRRALPLDQAMSVVVGDSGKAFDPKVVEILERRYQELERKAKEQAPVVSVTLPRSDLKVERGAAPAAGFEAGHSPASPGPEGSDFLASIAAARQEVQALLELAKDLGNSLSLDETLSVLAVRLKKMVPFDSMAIYVLREGQLTAEYVSGDNFRLFSSLKIPAGQGLSGWVAENRKPILNGNPSVEPGYLNDPDKFSILRAALSMPLEGVNGVVGVLTLYRAERDSFTRDHLRILLAICPKVAVSIENALKYRQAETSATTDYLTGLPNARSLFLHLDGELARCRRMGTPLAVVVTDLDGFKSINDRFGHLEGNKVLRAVGTRLRDSCREYDYVARMGGDEFVLVLPGMKPDDLKSATDRLSNIARMAGCEVCGEESLSLSAGSATYPEDGSDAEQLLAVADRKMYKAKQQQKVRVEAGRGWPVEWREAVQ